MSRLVCTVDTASKAGDHAPRRRTAWAAVAVAVLGITSLPAVAAEPQEEQLKPDWVGLASQLEDGEWAAAAASADRIAKLVEPKRRAPDYLPRSIALIQALMSRGRAELFLGDVPAADATLLEAYRIFKDRDFQRLFSIQARLPKNIVEVVALRMTWVELLDMRSLVILERLRHWNLAPPATGAGEGASERAELDEWLEEFGRLAKFSAGAREELAAIFDKGGPKVLTSPKYRALVGPFQPAVNDGIKALELCKLARGGRPIGDAAGAAAAGTPAAAAPTADRLLAEARESFKAARGALDDALQAALPKNATGLKPQQRIEAAVLQVELLTNQAAALLEAGELAAARANLAKVLELHREISVIRKRAQPGGHPDTLWPLLMAAEISLAESRQMLAQGAADKARAEATSASELLRQAAELQVPESQPLVGKRLRLAAELDLQLAAINASIPRSDAADTAARRVRRAVEAAREAAADF